uniref:Uncharacterized protein n=1 Tax=Laticauda laticaudata TaxID=8630 RepID=A0A8C5RZ47_LATLA
QEDEDFIKKLKEELTFYFKENNNLDTTIQNLWDTMKADIQGIIISYTAQKNKEKHKLESELQDAPQHVKLQEKMILYKHKLNFVEKEDLIRNVKVSKQIYSEQANKRPTRNSIKTDRKDRENNYIKLNQQIALDLTKWKNLQLSLIGRISTIKMSILPRNLNLFQTIPIRLGKDYFEDLNKIVLKYIWQSKKARIKLKILKDARIRGGFGLPNWELYYQAINLMWVKEWITLRNRMLHGSLIDGSRWERMAHPQGFQGSTAKRTRNGKSGCRADTADADQKPSRTLADAERMPSGCLVFTAHAGRMHCVSPADIKRSSSQAGHHREERPASRHSLPASQPASQQPNNHGEETEPLPSAASPGKRDSHPP